MARIQTLRNTPDKADFWDAILFSRFRKQPAQPDAERVEKMLSLLVAAERHSREYQSIGTRLDRLKGAAKGDAADAIDWAHEYQHSRSAYVRTLKQIDEALQHYQWRAMVSQESDSGHFQYELHCVANPKSPLGDWEGTVVAHLLKLTEKPGQISRFRRCSECHEWFYGLTGHQQFCGDSCRRRHAAQNPEFKEKRRIYMRERYRPLQKELEQRSMRNAKGTRQKKG